MASRGLVFKLKVNNAIPSIDMQNVQENAFKYTFYAEKNNGAFVNNYNKSFLGHTFICQYLHVFGLEENDMQQNKWCSDCNQIPKKRRKSSFHVNYNGSNDMIDINCDSGHAYQLNLGDLKTFKDCPGCTSSPKLSVADEDTATDTDSVVEQQLKYQESMFIEAYKRLIEAFPLIRKLPTSSMVSLYFENELYNLPNELQANCMAVYLIITQRSFVRAIFDRLNEPLKRKFFHKIVTGISLVAKFEPKTRQAYEYLHSLTH